MLLFFIPRDTNKYFDQGCHCTVGDAKGGCMKQFEFDEFEDTVLSLRADKRTTRLVPFPINEITFHLYICIECSVYVVKRSALFIQLVKKD